MAAIHSVGPLENSHVLQIVRHGGAVAACLQPGVTPQMWHIKRHICQQADQPQITDARTTVIKSER
jgi:hypothetical protein